MHVSLRLIGLLVGAALLGCDAPPPPSPASPGEETELAGQPTSRPTSRPSKAKSAGDCVGSCSVALDEHPDLSSTAYHDLLKRFGEQPGSGKSEALETLLFHHARTNELLLQHGTAELDPKRAALLTREAGRTHAWLDVRVIDQRGSERIRLKPTRVPLGIKQHLWPEDRVALQPVEVSGTVKRVGLDHLWTRL